MNSKVVLDSRAAGAEFPIAGIIGTAIEDIASVEAMIRRAKEAGYTGVCLIHPSHVAIANRVFRPTAEEVAFCRGMLAAFAEAEAQGLGAVRYEGRMVDYAMLPPARAVLEDAGDSGTWAAEDAAEPPTWAGTGVAAAGGGAIGAESTLPRGTAGGGAGIAPLAAGGRLAVAAPRPGKAKRCPACSR